MQRSREASTPMQDLEAVSSEYRPGGATEIENDLILRWYPERIVRRIGRCASLLELGVGHGFATPLFNEACDRHVIVEGAESVIDQFRANHPEFAGEVILDRFETFETDERFDAIIMGFVLEHVDDPGLVLDRFRPLLADDGRLFVAVPNAKSLNRRLGLELGLIDDIYSLNANDIALGHQRNFCRDTLKALLRERGYSVVYEEGIYLKPLPLAVLKTLDDMAGNLQAMLRVGIDFPDLCVALLMEVAPA